MPTPGRFKKRCLLDDNIVPESETCMWKTSLIYEGPCFLINTLILHKKRGARDFEVGDNLLMKDELKLFFIVFIVKVKASADEKHAASLSQWH